MLWAKLNESQSKVKLSEVLEHSIFISNHFWVNIKQHMTLMILDLRTVSTRRTRVTDAQWKWLRGDNLWHVVTHSGDISEWMGLLDVNGFRSGEHWVFALWVIAAWTHSVTNFFQEENWRTHRIVFLEILLGKGRMTHVRPRFSDSLHPYAFSMWKLLRLPK